jgi:hypothetical protein
MASRSPVLIFQIPNFCLKILKVAGSNASKICIHLYCNLFFLNFFHNLTPPSTQTHTKKRLKISIIFNEFFFSTLCGRVSWKKNIKDKNTWFFICFSSHVTFSLVICVVRSLISRFISLKIKWRRVMIFLPIFSFFYFVFCNYNCKLIK